MRQLCYLSIKDKDHKKSLSNYCYNLYLKNDKLHCRYYEITNQNLTCDNELFIIKKNEIKFK